MKFRSRFICVLILTSISVCTSLECLQCVSAWTQQECQQQDTQTCTATQGCMESSQCYDLQKLNDEDICRMEPSQCVYCCESNLCNAGMTSLPYPVSAYIAFCLYVTL